MHVEEWHSFPAKTTSPPSPHILMEAILPPFKLEAIVPPPLPLPTTTAATTSSSFPVHSLIVLKRLSIYVSNISIQDISLFPIILAKGPTLFVFSIFVFSCTHTVLPMDDGHLCSCRGGEEWDGITWERRWKGGGEGEGGDRGGATRGEKEEGDGAPLA